ncbi:MAG: cytochrome c oxidase subunit II [Planctomycetales bacterium]
MNQGFELFPDAGSAYAGDVDALYAFLVAVALLFTFGICFAILFFAVRYRSGSDVPRRPLAVRHIRAIEITWSVVPLLLTMVMFGWGAALYLRQQQPPDDALEIAVIGKQWMWQLQHAEGRREHNELHVPVGRPVRLTMISEDVIHSFYVPAFRVKQDVLPGRYTTLWFQPDRPGEHHLFCAEYCGTEHSLMRGRVIVQEPGEYARWLAGATGDAPAVAGRKLFEQFRCHTCHTKGEAARGPALEGLLGRKVPLAAGGFVVADEDYVRESILNPQAKVVAGFQPIMPTFEGQIGEEGILQIIAYIQSLSAEEAAGEIQQEQPAEPGRAKP